MAAVLLQMGFTDETRSQLILSLLSFGAILLVYVLVKKLLARDPHALVEDPATTPAQRVLVMANQTVEAEVLRQRLREIDQSGRATYWVCVPANPVDTGSAATKGAVYIEAATVRAAQERLDRTLAQLRADGLDANGAPGDYRPMRALADAIEEFKPDRLVISTLPLAESTWHRFEVIDEARARFAIPVTHVEAPSSLSPAAV